MKKTVFTFFLASISFLVYAQRDVKSSAISTPYIGIHYGANIPGDDYKDRFGFTNHLGGIFGWKFETNWILAVDGNFMFGGAVNEEGILDNISDSQGTITNVSGTQAEVLLMQRGFNVNGNFGFIFPNSGHNPNSGVMFLLGGGYMQHKIRIETQEDEVPQIQDEYLQGYDRLTAGFNTSQFLGYNYMADRGIYNFYVGFYFIQGHTYNKRSLFWDRPDFEVPTERRLDTQYGLRFGWMVPAYKRKTREFYMN